MTVDQVVEMMMARDPSLTREEAAAWAASEMSPPNRLDGAPDVELSELEAGSPLRRQYRYDSGTGQTTPATSDEQWAAEIKRDNSESGRYGSPWGTTDGFTSQQAADAYRYRAPGEPSQQDLDMLQTREGRTGWVEVYDPATGRTSLRRRAPAPSVEVVEGEGPLVNGVPITESPFYRMPDYAPGQSTAAYRYMQDLERGMRVEDPMPEYMDNFDWGGVELGWANEATGNQRVGPEVDNRDVTAEMPDVIPGGTRTRPKPAYDMVPVLGDGPMGPVYYMGYRPETEKERLEDYRQIEDERALRRAADRAGITMAEARAMKAQAMSQNQANPMQQIDPLQNIRDLAMNRRNADRRAREEAVRARNMLMGNDPRANVTNAFNRLDDESQRMAILGSMFPQGSTPLDVERARYEAEARLNARNAGADSVNVDFAREQAAAAREAELRQTDPIQVGMSDIGEGNYDSTAAQTVVDRLALQYDSGDSGFFGVGTMSYQDEDRLADALADPNGPYRIPRAEAERLAFEASQRRRWLAYSSTPPGERGGQSETPPSGPPAPQSVLPPDGRWRPPAGMPGV